MAGQNVSNIDQFDAYFRKADLDGDGQISGAEAVAFFQGSNLPKQVLAQVWAYADQRKAGFLNRAEFYNSLKLVTVAQSKRELTPDIVKAALYGPASSKIPAPQINLGATPAPQPRVGAATPQLGGTPSASSSVSSSPQNIAVRGSQGLGNANSNQQFFSPRPNQYMGPPQAMSSGTPPRPQQVVATRSIPTGGTTVASSPLPSNMSNDWLGGGTGVSGGTSLVSSRGISPPTTQDQFGTAASNLTPAVQPRSPATSGRMTAATSKPVDANPEALAASGNGFPSDSLFGDVFSSTSVQTKEGSLSATSSAGSLLVSATTTPASPSPQPPVKPNPLESLQGTISQQHVGSQYQQNHLAGKQNQQFAAPSTNASASTGFHVGPANSSSTQSQIPWPKMTQASVQKYTKVFVQVDTDRDGKITGQQARNLFLSWRLPREILKQVWDLSDQDNDSMLSLREFCTALYLMERFREGRPLPTTLPTSIDEALFSTTGRPTAPHGAAPWAPAGGLNQSQPSRPPLGKPPRPVPVSHHDKNVHPVPQKPKIPELEKHLVDQLSKEEQESLNVKLKEATDADKKVEELEKEIVTAKEKIEFYHAKMQELILYKSRCDNRLNEIIERVAGDKHEVEALSKKYEEKYKQAGDVASRLSIEEATFRDIQEKKMELYQAIVKMEADSGDGALQQRVDHIQTGLEELVKNLNERCKQYGLRAKPTSLVELPFGWQPGIQEGTADWDEDWDKFEDEGFTFVKELTLDVQNVIAPPKPKSVLVHKELTSTTEDSNVSSLDADTKSDRITDKGAGMENDLVHDKKEGAVARRSPESPAKTVAGESHSQDFQDSEAQKNLSTDGSPHAKEARSKQGGAESVFSGDKAFDEPPGWGTFDTHYDTDSVWGFDTDKTKDLDHDKHDSLFGPDFSLKPIKTEPSRGNNLFQGKPSSVFADSVPSTPAYSIGGSPRRFSTGPDDYSFDKGKVSSIFADSVPSTPAYSFTNSPRRFSGGSDEHSFDSFSRFDSFNMHDGGLFQSPRHSLSRFDSVRSSKDSDLGIGHLPKFDSFNAHDGAGLFQSSQSSVARFDSFRSTRDSDHGFPSFDDTDPFGSTGPFRTSKDSQTPKRGFDSDPFGSTGPFRPSFDGETPRRSSDIDPFGSTGPFKTSVESQTPRKGFDTDIFGSTGPFKSSVETDTVKKGSEKKDSDIWSAF